MKFGYNPDGKLVPLDELELRSKLEEMTADLESRELADRTRDVVRIRELLVSDGQVLSPEDENVLTLYAEGILDYHNVEYHFGERLSTAVLRRGGRGGGAV